MTAPDTGALRRTVAAGGRAVMLTEYAPGSDDPVTIINDSATRVYLASDSSAGSSSGTPLDPHTSTSWAAAGQVWAATDPAAAADATLYLTRAVSDWTPDPAVIGAAIAAQLLAQGVPSVLVEKELAFRQVIAGGGAVEYDVSGYASVCISIATNPIFNANTDVEIKQTEGEGVLVDVETLTAPFDVNAEEGGVTARLAVVGQFLSITNNNNTQGVIYTLTASNRAAPRLDVRLNASRTAEYSAATAPLTGGQVYELAPLLDIPTVQQGQVFLRFALTVGTAARGYLTAEDGRNRFTVLADSSEMVAGAGGFQVMKFCALPAGPVVFAFHCTTGGTAAIDLQVTACNVS